MKKLVCLLLAAALLCGNVGKMVRAEEVTPPPEETVQATAEATPTPEPTLCPENPQEPTPEPATQTPAAEPEDTPAGEMTQPPAESATPEPEESTQPSPEPAVTDTPVPQVSDTPVPEQSASPEASATPRPELDEAWIWQEDGGSCLMVTGKLFDFVEALTEETDIFLSTVEVLCLKNVHVQQFLLANLLLDEQYFLGDGWLICVSETDPTKGETAYGFDPEQWEEALPEDVITLYVWVTYLPAETESPEPSESETPVPDTSESPLPNESETPVPDTSESPVPDESVSPEPSLAPTATPDPDAVILQVDAENFVAGGWGSQVPVFRLSGIPEDKEGYSYAAIIFDKQFVVLSEDSYTAAEEGIYTVRLVILDEMYDIVSASDNYTLWLDYTMPELMITMDEQQDYTVHISADDLQSGLAGITLDGGETWIEMPEEGVYTITAQAETTYPAGMIQARDQAGNITVCDQDVTLIKIPSWGGGGGGGGGGSKPVPHAPATSVSSSAYNAVGLELTGEAMHTLVMDGEELELTLELLAAEGMEIPAEYEAKFRLSLDSWTERVYDAEGLEQMVRDLDSPDVLVLEVANDEVFLEDCEVYSLSWQINGAVIRKLANSGINYLVLKAADDLVVLPTEGFTAGTRYAELKMAGVSTKKFNYTIRMDVDRREQQEDDSMTQEQPLWKFSETCDVQISVAVEEEAWVLPIAQEGEMYTENVYCGPYAMMEVPYGEYQIGEEDE